MDFYRLPFNTDQPYQRYQTTLDGVSYTVRLRWNARSEAWTIGIGDADGNFFVESERLSPGFQVFRNVVDARMPPGRFVCVDVTGVNDKPGRYDFDEKCQVLYTND